MRNENRYSNVTAGSIFECGSSFFQVVRRSGNTIYTRQIKGKAVAWTGMKAEDWTPFPNEFKSDDTYRSKLTSYDVNNNSVLTRIRNLDCTLRLN